MDNLTKEKIQKLIDANPVMVFMKGTKLRDLTKPLLHAFHGKKGARKFRQILSDNIALSHNDFALINKAIEQIEV